jgi:hypothetical protein
MAEGLDNRHRDRDGTVDRKRGDTQIGSLRLTYGNGFAAGYPSHMRLESLLARTGHTSLSDYLSRQKGPKR